MKNSQQKVGKDEIEDIIKLEQIEKILDLQKYPIKYEKYLKMISEESNNYGLLWGITRAYLFGMIIGKRIERKKKYKI